MSFVAHSPAAPWSSQFPTLGQVCLFLLVGSVFLSFPPWFFVSWREEAVNFHFGCIIKLGEAGPWHLRAGGAHRAVAGAPLPGGVSLERFPPLLAGLQLRGTALSHLL